MVKLGMTPESIGPPRIVAQSNVLNRMIAPSPGNQPRIPEAAWPNDEYFLPSKDFFFNGEAVMVYHVPTAHTDGDSLVFFRRSDVLSTGDVFTPGRYPIIDLARGGSVQGEIDALNQIIDITVPGEISGRRHAGDPRPRPPLRRSRRGGISQHADHHSRPLSGHDPQGHDAGAGEGRQAHA